MESAKRLCNDDPVASIEPLAHDIGLVVTLRLGATGDSLEATWVRDHLSRYGAIVFRGLTPSVDGFKTFTAAHSGVFSDYKGGGLRFGSLDREAIGGDNTVLTVTGNGQGFPIPLHGEMYYMPQPPDVLWFYCNRPPEHGGQTTVARASGLFAHLKPETQNFFRAQKLSYRRLLRDGDWQKTFLTNELACARDFAHGQGLTWSHDSATRKVCISHETSALRKDATGREMFINNLQFVQAGEDAFLSGWAAENLGFTGEEWPFVVRMEDGTSIPRDVLADVEHAEKEAAHDINWQQGDIAMIDNRTTLHGRRATQDTQREIFVRLGLFGDAQP